MGAYGSEVKATLGVDTTQVPADMAKARAAFNKGAQEIEQDSARHGAGAGDKLVGALEHKLLGARHLSGALATALGLNIEKISEHITEAIENGSKEGWKRAGEIADENSRLIGERIEANLTPKGLEENLKKQLERAVKEAEELAKEQSVNTGYGLSFAGGVPSITPTASVNKELSAEQLEKQQEAQQKILKLQARIDEEAKRSREQILQLDEQIESAQDKKGTLAEKEASVKEHIKKLQLDYVNGNYTELELKKKQLEISQKENDLAAIHKEQKQHELDLEVKTLAVSQKRAELEHEKVTLAKDQAKLSDRSKLTVGELAELHTNKRSAIDEAAQESERNRNRAFSFGRDADLTSEQAAARDKAEEIKDLEAKAERARKSGDTAGASSILDQVGQMRDALVKSGFTKSTEGDPATALREQIAKDNEAIKKTLSSIETIEKGKYINQ